MTKTDGWTDDELRAAIHEAAGNAQQKIVVINHNVENTESSIAQYELDDLRHLLTALGIDHQPKPELPTEPGSMIWDVLYLDGTTCPVMTLGLYGYWVGHDHHGEQHVWSPDNITSFGGVLDLDEVRGEQGE